MFCPVLYVFERGDVPGITFPQVTQVVIWDYWSGPF